jgi:hypothetical protein
LLPPDEDRGAAEPFEPELLGATDFDPSAFGLSLAASPRFGATARGELDCCGPSLSGARNVSRRSRPIRRIISLTLSRGCAGARGAIASP